jgi:threonine dehydratase
VRTPLLRLHVDDAPAEIYLKLETLQPINSFKIRGAYNAMAQAPRDELAKGVVTTSAGNMAQGVGWAARELGIPFTVIVPDHAPGTKLAAIERLGVTGIASAVKTLRPETELRVVELETAAPLTASLAAGEPREIEYRTSFVDGAGARAVLPKMWGLARPLIDGSDVVTLDETAAAVRLLAERVRVVAEGAGALAVAAALSGRAGGGKIVAIVSGGNIDSSVLAAILAGETP